jgi:hypothetical protein
MILPDMNLMFIKINLFNFKWEKIITYKNGVDVL